jgi:hypothetical protein
LEKALRENGNAAIDERNEVRIKNDILRCYKQLLNNHRRQNIEGDNFRGIMDNVDKGFGKIWEGLGCRKFGNQGNNFLKTFVGKVVNDFGNFRINCRKQQKSVL